MPLSEHEQRILDEIERRLAEEDPKFARSTTKATPRGVALARLKRGVLAFIAGLGVLLAGLLAGGSLIVPLGLCAFAMMLASVLFMARAAREAAGAPSRRAEEGGEGGEGGGWFGRLEQRWRKRFERDGDI